MFHFYSYNQDRFMQCYHKRSNVETTFHMIKTKFGDRLRSKTRTAQINEALCKVLAHNLCCLIQSMYELGIEPTFWADDEHQSCNYVACPNKPGLADETKLSHRRLHRYRASRC